jgi:hypothetical protein
MTSLQCMDLCDYDHTCIQTNELFYSDTPSSHLSWLLILPETRAIWLEVDVTWS